MQLVYALSSLKWCRDSWEQKNNFHKPFVFFAIKIKKNLIYFKFQQDAFFFPVLFFVHKSV